MKNKSSTAVRHGWRVSTAQARAIQQKLREKWVGVDRLGQIRTIAGLDAAFLLTESQALRTRSTWDQMRAANRAIGCAVVFCYPEMEEVERAFAVVPLEFPYIPGLLSFREIPALLAALKKWKRKPDLLFCDAHGYAHPRRMGLASHVGVYLNRPSIGCAKSILIGKHGPLGNDVGNWSALVDNGERIGAAVRTRPNVNPIYISQGNRISLETAIRLTLDVTDGFRIPRPTRLADRFASEMKRKLTGA